jgi:hypothetical protein
MTNDWSYKELKSNPDYDYKTFNGNCIHSHTMTADCSGARNLQAAHPTYPPAPHIEQQYAVRV